MTGLTANCTVLVMLVGCGTLVSTAASAQAVNPCEESTQWAYSGPGWPDHIPNCELQLQPLLTFKALRTHGYAFYCTGDHPYYWGYEYGYYRSYYWENNCLTVAENESFESGAKFDATFTNWCVSDQSTTLVLACSDTPQPKTPCCLPP